VPHQMEKMQKFIDFIFFEVWCKANSTLIYSLDLFDPLTELWELMRDFTFDIDPPLGAKFFYEHVESIYKEFTLLTPHEIDSFKSWYIANNDIIKICANDPTTQIARYIDIQVKHPKLSKLLASFFRGLYDNSLLSLSALKSKIGSLKEHSLAFFTINNIGKCPFCGINDLKGVHHTRREAYDHYLPKYRYPFNSINFYNLAPACNECNSVYKLSKDPAHHPKKPSIPSQRRKFFHPFSSTHHVIDLQVTFQHANMDNLKPKDIDLVFGPSNIAEQIDTWKDVYGIEERYKAKFCGENDGKYWLTQVLDEWKEDGRQPTDFLKTLTRQAQNQPYAECNFLKKPFLDACEDKGLFNN
jgi:hypothetical protein